MMRLLANTLAGVRRWPRRLRALLRRASADRELSNELAFHLEMETEKHIRAGLDPAAARRAALLAFGGVDRFAEAVRDVRSFAWLEDLRLDLRQAARGFRRAPGFTIAALVALSLGIGANTAVFSVVHAVVLAPLPYAEPDRLVRLWESHPTQNVAFGAVSPGTYVDLRERSRTLERIAMFGERDMLFTENGETWESRVSAVTPDFFELLGIRPALGRTLGAGTEQAAGDEVVIGHGLWQSRFGGDSGVVGRTLRLDYLWSYTIVGVMPPRFELPVGVEVWVPLDYGPTVSAQERQYRYYGGMARLRPGATLEQAQREVAALARQLETEHPASNAGWTVRLASLDRSIVGDARTTLLVLLGLAGCVLLIACGNVATLAVARATARRHETAVRFALGAGVRRLVRQWMTEGVLLALAGGVGGVLSGYWSSRLMLGLAPSEIPRLDEAAFDGPVLVFAMLATCAAALIVGLAPALRTREIRVLDALRSRIGGAGSASARTREWLLGTQVALTFVLVVSAALLVRSFERLRSTDLGFRPHEVLSVEMRVPGGRFPFPPWFNRLRYYERLMTELDAIPGVRSVAGTTNIPFTGDVGLDGIWLTDAPGAHGDQPPTSAADQWKAVTQAVTPGYFETMGIPVLRGRAFEAADRFTERQLTDDDVPRPPGVAVINDAMAKQYFPDADPLGQSIILFDDRSFAAHRTIVGVVGDFRVTSVDSAASPTIYLPFAQHPGRAVSLVLRADLPPEQLVGSVTQRLRAFGEEISIRRVRPLDAVVGNALSRPRFAMLLVGSFAVLALAIAAVGVFGIVAFLVARRTREIGIRMALGARPSSVLRLVLAEGLRPVLLGVVVGSAGAVVVARAMHAMLYGLAPLDVTSFASAAVLLLGASLLAAGLPARRALGGEPLRALRSD